MFGRRRGEAQTWPGHEFTESGPFAANVGSVERWMSTIGGAALVATAIRREDQRPLLAGAGLALLARGLSGYCPISATIGRNTARTDTREALSGSRGVLVETAVTIDRPVHEVYTFWRRLENLPRFMRHLESVTDQGGGRSHWVAHAPLGSRVEWDAEIINEEPDHLIAWRSCEDADVVSAGSVTFRPVPGGRGTEVRVRLQYEPPAGKAGSWLAWLTGEEPSVQIPEDLGRLKQLLETGEVPMPQSSRIQNTGRTSPAGDGRYHGGRT
jgi:uncharacterized membrane protein